MRLDYAKLHNYDFIIDLEANNQRGLMWHKFDMVQRVINGSQHDWVWWIDFDTLVMNMNIKVSDIIEEELSKVSNPDKIDFLFTPDWYVAEHELYHGLVKLYLTLPIVLH